MREGGIQGESFAKVVRGETDTHRSYAITGRNLNDHWGTVPATVTDGIWSLVYWPNKDLAYQGPPVREETYPMTGMPERRRDELFYLPEDPDQERNLLGEHPDQAQRLHSILLELIESTDTDHAIAETYGNAPS